MLVENDPTFLQWNGSYKGAPSKGGTWTSGDCKKRVCRSECWICRPQDARSADRAKDTAGKRDSRIGFRAARALDDGRQQVNRPRDFTLNFNKRF